MPINYVLDHARRRVVARGTGDITLVELLEYARSRVTGGAASYDQLFDARGATMGLSVVELEQLVVASKLAHAGAPFGRTAIVADLDDSFGVAKMAELLSGRGGITSRAFRTVREASAWLDGAPSAAPESET